MARVALCALCANKGLTKKNTVRVKVHGGVITLHELPDGQVKVDMGEPVLDLPRIPFNLAHASPVNEQGFVVAFVFG
jgi:diaminopimelate epimerase